MSEYFLERPLKRPPTHPGEVLREEVLNLLGLSVSEAAKRLNVSRQQLHRVLACAHPITTEIHVFTSFPIGLSEEALDESEFLESSYITRTP